MDRVCYLTWSDIGVHLNFAIRFQFLWQRALIFRGEQRSRFQAYFCKLYFENHFIDGSILFSFGHMACGILVPQPGIELGPWHQKPGILTTRRPENSENHNLQRGRQLIQFYKCIYLYVTQQNWHTYAICRYKRYLDVWSVKIALFFDWAKCDRIYNYAFRWGFKREQSVAVWSENTVTQFISCLLPRKRWAHSVFPSVHNHCFC